MRTLLADLWFGGRLFARTPAFTFAAVVSLALGMGANTAIFSVASALLLRPLPYAGAERLVILWNRSPGLGIVEDWFSTAQYFDIRNSAESFEEVALAIGSNVNLTGEGAPERVGMIRVSSNLLPMLGVRAAHGRLFTADDDIEGAAPSVVLQHGTWMRRYGGDPSAVGRHLILNGTSHQIVGVLPPGFSLRREVMPTLGVVADAEILASLPLPANAPQIRGREDYNILAALGPGRTVQGAQAEMDRLTARLRQDHPEVYPPNGALTFGVVPLKEQVVGDARRPLWILGGAVAFVLLIACANVANLLLSRALGRHREMAVRAALGAGRARLVRQLMSESVLLALAGGLLGLLFAYWTLEGIRVLGPASVPRLHEITIDPRVLGFTLALSVASGVLFGLAPALRAGRVDLQAALKDGTRGMAGAGQSWGRSRSPRRLLVVAEVALAVVVLIGAGLLIRSFAHLQNVDPGFEPRGVLTLEITLTGQKYPDPPAIGEAYERIWNEVRRLPGVETAGGISALPLSGMMAWGPVTIEGREPPPGERFLNADQRIVFADYFETMRIPLVSGRLFGPEDARNGQRVAIIDEFMARQHWPDPDAALGRRIKLGAPESTSPWVTIVGVVGRIRQDALDADSRITVYVAHTQYTSRASNVVVRTATDPVRLAAEVTGVIRGLDADLPIYNVQTMEARVDGSLARRRFVVVLLGSFAALALGLSAIGVYGVIAYLVSQGTREIGIRMALGATPGGILALVLRHGLTAVLLGVGIGLVTAAGVVQFMHRLLFGVDPLDPVTFGGVAITLALIALAATAIPAVRAARVDPSVSLRAD